MDRLAEGVVDDARDVAREVAALRESAAASFTRVRNGVGATPRFARVAGELLRLTSLYRAHAALHALGHEWLGDDVSALALERLHRANARRLHGLCVELRGGVLKLGQLASSRVDLLPEAYLEWLSRLQDRVPPVPLEQIRERIAQELGPPEAIFASLEETALAAASLAQVHGAVLPDGRRVVVKVQVPGVERALEADLAAVRLALPALASLAPGLDLETIADELCRSLANELDYRAEARHATALAASLADQPGVVVPRVYGELSSHRVLVLERLEGTRLVDWLEACEGRGEEGARQRDRLFQLLIRSFCAQVLRHGICQADPHPGNFLVLEGEGGPRLALLDFGSVQHYPPRRRRAWAELALAILGRDEARMTRLFAELGFESRDGGQEALRGFAELLLERFREGADPAAAEGDSRARLRALLALLQQSPVLRIPQDFVQLGRIFAALGGLVLRYRPRVDLFALIAPEIAAALSADEA
jgi:ubiquinone biosynthesis protein